MIDKEKIRKEVEIVVNRRLNLLNGDYFDLNKEVDGFTNEITDIIDSMQEESVDEDFLSLVDKEARELWKEINSGNDFSIVDSFNQFYGICMQVAESTVEWQKNPQESASEDLEEAAEEWDESLYRSDAFKAGAQWQKEKDAKILEFVITNGNDYPTLDSFLNTFKMMQYGKIKM